MGEESRLGEVVGAREIFNWSTAIEESTRRSNSNGS